MADFLVTAPDLPTLMEVAAQVSGLVTPQSTDQQGNVTPAHLNSGGFGPELGGWAFAYIGPWMVPTGATALDAFGNPQPVMAPKDSNVYGILRVGYDPEEMPLPKGVNLVTDPATGAMSVTVGSVSMVSPLPDGVPLRFE